ncbi:MAG: ABC transporter ATP-binding protein [Rubripirellula sp.]
MTSSSIHCNDLSLQFPRGPRAVAGVDLHGEAGEITSLIGPSGCGKTSLLRLIASLHEPTSGSVELSPAAESKRGQLSFVFQQPTLLPWRTALQNVCLPLELVGQQDASERKAIATAMLETVGLADAQGRFPEELSGGMKMRVSLARALITEPSVLLLDEPFAALDDMLRNQLGDLLLSLWQDRQFTAVMVTHNIGEAILLSHRIAVMHDGSVSETIENPLDWPRGESTRSTPAFASFYGQVSQSLRKRMGETNA